MQISFALFPTEKCNLYIHKFYQVLFLDREDDRIDTWTAVVASAIWPAQSSPPEFKAILSVKESTGGWMVSGPQQGITDPTAPDVWRAIRKIWGAQSQNLIDGEPITISNIIETKAEWLASSGVIGDYIMFGINHGFAKAQKDDYYDPLVAGEILEKELIEAKKNGGLFGILMDKTSQSLLPLALGTYTESIDRDGSRLALPATDSTVIPALWWMRHTVNLPPRPLGINRRKQFDYEVILAKEGGPGDDRLAEYRSYLVAPQFFELEQSSAIRIETGSLTPPEAGPRELNPHEELGGGDFNSLDRQQKTHEAYLAAWVQEKKIERREYYKLNLPGNVRDHRTPFNRVVLGVRLKSSLGEIRLYVIGVVITLLLGIGIDGDRLSHIVSQQEAAGWPVFLPVVSALIQWIAVSVLVLSLYLVDLFARHGTGTKPAPVPAGGGNGFERTPTLARLARWGRRFATGFYLFWAIGAFGLDHEGQEGLSAFTHRILGDTPRWMEAPRSFGVLAAVVGFIALVLMLVQQPKLAKDISRFIFERN